MELMATIATRESPEDQGNAGPRVIPTVFPHLFMVGPFDSYARWKQRIPRNDFPGRRGNYTVHPAK